MKIRKRKSLFTLIPAMQTSSTYRVLPDIMTDCSPYALMENKASTFRKVDLTVSVLNWAGTLSSEFEFEEKL